MYIFDPKIEEHHSNIDLSRDIQIESMFYFFSGTTYDVIKFPIRLIQKYHYLYNERIYSKKKKCPSFILKNLLKMEQLVFISWALWTNYALKKFIVKYYILLLLLVRKKYLSFGVGVFLEEVTDNFIKTVNGQRYVNCRSVCLVTVTLH